MHTLANFELDLTERQDDELDFQHLLKTCLHIVELQTEQYITRGVSSNSNSRQLHLPIDHYQGQV